MGKGTKIEWADHTWNPWYGCTKVSTGCKNCYAERDMIRFGKNFNTIHRSKTTFSDPLSWDKPAKVFVCSWSDFFHEDVPLDWLDEAWEIMKQTPHLTYLLLTKRAQNIAHALPDDWGEGYPNVWIGVTVEDNDQLWRLCYLEDVKAVRRFVSAEPLLGPISEMYMFFPSIDWVIVGGESGPNARQMYPEWVEKLRDLCLEDDTVAFFFKQWGGKSKDRDGTWGGRMLDGREWSEVPALQESK